MEFGEVNSLLDAGYLPFESGYKDLSDGKMLVAALTRMPGCRAKMVDWWFSWLGGIEQYRWWHPTDHVSSAWENRTDGRYVGAHHLVEEYLAGASGPLFSLRISFHEPTDIFDASRYRASGALAVCARIGEQDAPAYAGRMCHFVRDTDDGCEMRSPFWLGEIEPRDPAHAIGEDDKRALRRDRLNTEFARRLHQHATEEMGYLAEILPVLYRRETLDSAT